MSPYEELKAAIIEYKKARDSANEWPQYLGVRENREKEAREELFRLAEREVYRESE